MTLLNTLMNKLVLERSLLQVISLSACINHSPSESVNQPFIWFRRTPMEGQLERLSEELTVEIC